MRLPTADDLILAQNNRDLIIIDYFAQGELLMLFAPSGVGKTFNALNMALTICAGGSYYQDAVVDSRPCLYIDGELKLATLGNRIQGMMQSRDLHTCPNFYFISAELFTSSEVPNLSYKANQDFIDNLIEMYQVKVLFLDNYNTLFPDDGSLFATWDRTSSWLKKLRTNGISVVLVHHTNKGDISPAGTAKMEQLMDVVISFQKSPIAKPSETMLEMNFLKTRNTESKPKKLVQLISDDRGKRLEHLNYQDMLRDRVQEDYELRGFQYVSTKYKIPSWQIRDICNITAKEEKTKNSSNSFDNFIDISKSLSNFL